MNGLRRVEFFEWVHSESTGYEKNKAGEGIFHRWGSRFEEFETEIGNETVAVVEKDDGEVVMASPDMIRFLEPPPKPESGVTTIENVAGPLSIKL